MIFLRIKPNFSHLEQKTVSGEEVKAPDNIAANFDKFVNEARTSTNGINLGTGSTQNINGLQYDFAKCCNPIPGDDVIGFISQEKGIRIHQEKL